MNLVVDLLKANSERVFTCSEVAVLVDRNVGGVRKILEEMYDAGVVERNTDVAPMTWKAAPALAKLEIPERKSRGPSKARKPVKVRPTAPAQPKSEPTGRRKVTLSHFMGDLERIGVPFEDAFILVAENETVQEAFGVALDTLLASMRATIDRQR
jgi:hypothetical protein